MKKLSNGCSYSEPWISPEDWRTTTSKKSLLKTWYVQTYFFDPLFQDKYPKGFPWRKKLNRFKTLEERKAAAKLYLDEIPKLFEDKGWNPITKTFMIENHEENQTDDISPDSLITNALEFVYDRWEAEKKTKSEVRTILNQFNEAILKLRYHELKISEFKRKHYKLIIENIERSHDKFSAHKFNKYRTYISTLFSELVEYEAVESNIIKDIRKRVMERKIPILPSHDERLIIKNHLMNNYPDFWRFTIIFFHSGGRITELLRLQIKDVDLNRQVYKTLIKKGKLLTWVERPIKDIALHFWQRSVFGGKPDDYVFSDGLVPGPKIIAYKNIQRRWKTHVKDKLKIQSNLYALKHVNLDETASILSINDAARLAGHTSTQMVVKHYALGENERQMNRLKKISNEF